MKIDLFYNPFFGEASLLIDGVKYTNTHSRLYGYISRPIKEWLKEKNASYESWNGFFVELTEEVNEDDYEFFFHGKTEDYSLISDAFSIQCNMLKEQGYDPDNIQIHPCVEYDSSEIKNRLCFFIKSHLKSLKDQDYMNRIDSIYRDAQIADQSQVDNLREIYDRLLNLFLYAKEKAVDKIFWDELIGDVKMIFKKAV